MPSFDPASHSTLVSLHLTLLPTTITQPFSRKMEPAKQASIAVIVCSTRQPRVCPQIADFVVQTIRKETLSETTPTLNLIDLSEWDLPLFNEPTIPSQIHHHSNYVQPHTQAWSQEIQKYSGFIFVLPQYNWGYPAVVKNAIDYLFNEWKGKSAMIVSYGGHGGTKSAAQLRQVLQGVRMQVAETMPALTFPDRSVHVKAAKGEDLGFQDEGGLWDAERDGIVRASKELLVLLSQPVVQEERRRA